MKQHEATPPVSCGPETVPGCSGHPACVLQDPLPGWVLNADPPRGTAGPWGASPPAGTAGSWGASPPAAPQRWHGLQQSKQPSPAPAQLLPALPGLYLLSGSFPPLLLSLFQGAAAVGAGVAPSLVPTLLRSPGSPRCAVLEGHPGGRVECQIPAMVSVPAQHRDAQPSSEGTGDCPPTPTPTPIPLREQHTTPESLAAPAETELGPASAGDVLRVPWETVPSSSPLSPSGCSHWDGNSTALGPLPCAAPAGTQSSNHPAIPQMLHPFPAPTRKETFVTVQLRKAAGLENPAVPTAGWAGDLPSPQPISCPLLPPASLHHTALCNGTAPFCVPCQTPACAASPQPSPGQRRGEKLS